MLNNCQLRTLTCRRPVDRANTVGIVPTFEQLIAEGSAVDVTGWDFSWFAGRASEERPPWGYARLLGERMAALAGIPDAAALDLQTGGGELLASIPAGPPVLVATESWPPNIEIARANLKRVGARVISVADELSDLPFADGAFDLVVSRHPVAVWWHEVARVLRPGGRYFSQQVGPGSVGELTEFLMGPRSDGTSEREPSLALAAAQAAGLTVTDLRAESLRTEFFDVGAVIYFLRKVIWIVPGFTAEGYRAKLEALHDQITARGPFIATTRRFLIEAEKPRVPSPG